MYYRFSTLSKADWKRHNNEYWKTKKELGFENPYNHTTITSILQDEQIQGGISQASCYNPPAETARLNV